MPDLKFSDAPRIICKEMFALCVQNTNVLIGRNNDSHVNFFFDEPFSSNENNFRHWKLLRSCVHELHGRCGSSPCVVDIIHASKTYNFISSTATTHTHTHRVQPVFQKQILPKLFKKILIFFQKFSNFNNFVFWRRRPARPSPRGKNSSKLF